MILNSFPKIAFFGTSDFSIYVLEALKSKGFVPSFIITQQDKPKGRNLLLTPPPIKVWAEKNSIEFIQPAKLDDSVIKEIKDRKIDLCILASYGKIIPSNLLNVVPGKILNVHPSLLPKYRGASPVQSMILNDEKDIGVTIMIVDEKMDHGPIVAQEKVEVVKWPVKSSELKEKLGTAGGNILAKIIPDYMNGKNKAKTQDEESATFTRKFEKEDGLVDLLKDGYSNYLRFCALSESPGVYFFAEKADKKIRIVVKDAKFEDGKFIPTRVVPEGKKEMKYEDFLRGLKK